MKKNYHKNAISFYQSLCGDFSSLGNPDLLEVFQDGLNEWAFQELERLSALFRQEKKEGFSDMPLFGDSENAESDKTLVVAGVDEVGRGPMAGPVVACAVVFDRLHFLPGLDDSKKLEASLREQICLAVKNCALSFSTGVASAGEIDKINIHNASLLAMRRAVENLETVPDLLLIDGRHKIPGLSVRQKPIIKGDSRSYSIAAASIVAKVTRDAIMAQLDREFPGYRFARHKGYCTRIHKDALARLGPCPVHRKTYAPVKVFSTLLS